MSYGRNARAILTGQNSLKAPSTLVADVSVLKSSSYFWRSLSGIRRVRLPLLSRRRLSLNRRFWNKGSEIVSRVGISRKIWILTDHLVYI